MCGDCVTITKHIGVKIFRYRYMRHIFLSYGKVWKRAWLKRYLKCSSVWRCNTCAKKDTDGRLVKVSRVRDATRGFPTIRFFAIYLEHFHEKSMLKVRLPSKSKCLYASAWFYIHMCINFRRMYTREIELLRMRCERDNTPIIILLLSVTLHVAARHSFHFQFRRERAQDSHNITIHARFSLSSIGVDSSPRLIATITIVLVSIVLSIDAIFIKSTATCVLTR